MELHLHFPYTYMTCYLIKYRNNFGLVVRVLCYKSGGPGSIPCTARKKVMGSGTESNQPREYN
jgi:hypothetical protein